MVQETANTFNSKKNAFSMKYDVILMSNVSFWSIFLQIWAYFEYFDNFKMLSTLEKSKLFGSKWLEKQNKYINSLSIRII